MKFDRSQYKTTKSLATQEKELADKLPSKSNDKGRMDIFEIKKEGTYYFRWWPVHIGIDSYFLHAHVMNWMNIDKDKYVDKKLVKDADGNAVRIIGKGTVLNAKVHGGFEKDIVEEYITFLKNQSEDLHSDTVDRKLYLRPIAGNGKQGKDFVGGIKPVESYMGYASLMEKGEDGVFVEKEFIKARIKPSVRSGMQALTSTESSDETIQTDPFTDPEDGFIVKVVFDKTEGKKDMSKYYVTSFVTENYVPIKSPLPEGFEKRYEGIPNLLELYSNRYTSETFSTAIDGLHRFDKEHGYGLFDNDEFLGICEELSAMYPEPSSKEDDKKDESKPTEEAAKEETPTAKAKVTKEPEAAPTKEEMPDLDKPTPEQSDADTTMEQDQKDMEENPVDDLPFKVDEKSEQAEESIADRMKKLRKTAEAKEA